MKKFKKGGVVPGAIKWPISGEDARRMFPLLFGERLIYKKMSEHSKHDSVILKSGRELYAYGRVLGLSLDGDGGTIYYGHDGHVGEFDGGLSDEEKKEVYGMMIKKLTELLEGLS